MDAEFLKAFPMGSVKILVVDDFEEFRRLVCSALQQGPEFQVTLAPDGLEAVQKAKESQPDLILLDIGLPNLKRVRGRQACACARSCKNPVR